jgi:hypothetical protein
MKTNPFERMRDRSFAARMGLAQLAKNPIARGEGSHRVFMSMTKR